MAPVILVVHIMLSLAIIGLVLIQRSEGGGLGIGGGSGGGMGGLATAKGTANALTRATAICATLFFMTSLALGVIASRSSKSSLSVLDSLNAETSAVTAPVGEGIDESQTEETKTPSAPIAE